MSAATLTQSAKSKENWNQVVNEWQQAIDLMKNVPAFSSNYAIAQKKVGECQLNLDYALRAAVLTRHFSTNLGDRLKFTGKCPSVLGIGKSLKTL